MSAEVESESASARARVVVAQDEPQTLQAIQVNLEEAGYDAVLAADGVQAYEAVESGEPAAIILDLDLARMSGSRLVRLIRRNPRWQRIPLIVTSVCSAEEVQDIFDDRIDGFVTRPFSPGELMSRLEWALRRDRQLIAS